MKLGLEQKVAMVSGASKGLGFAVARALALEGARLSIAASDQRRITDAAERLRRETGATVIGVAADVRSAEALEGWHAATMKEYGGVDLLFTNSGGPPAGPVVSFDDATWHDQFDLLVLSVVRLVRLVAPAMEARGGGSILMNTSTTVKDPIPNLALSTILRTPVVALAKILAFELAPRGIRVNCVMPGRIATDRMREIDQMKAKNQGIPIADQEARAVAEVPLGRYGTPDEFGRQAAFLLSDAASYITGTLLPVDGGLLKGVG